ncbi:MAG: T9SS type A sorting domain-containing protein [Bacteroidota bacterium]|nr:T9SS type A sorting domain-containing protein [Bacteroidota bacterium]
MQVATDSAFSAQSMVAEDSTIVNTLYPLTSLEHFQQYLWRVRGENSDSIGTWSQTWSFTTTSSQLSQKIALLQGWNMISSYIQPRDSTLDTIFASAKANITLLKNPNGKVYWPSLNINDIGYWSLRDGYQIYMKAADSVEFDGNQAVPESTQINLTSGWNLIAYLRNSALPIDSSLSSVKNYVVIAKNSAGQVYWPSQSINTIGSMVPGAGYQINVNQQCALLYPANGTAILAKTIAKNTLFNKPVHYLSELNTGINATLLVKSSQFSEGDEVGVWNAERKLVGSGVVSFGRAIIAVWGRNAVTDSINGAAEQEALSLTVWSVKKQKELLLSIAALTDGITNRAVSGGLRYATNAVWIADAAIIQEIPTTYSLEQNFPNPFNPSTTIRYGLPEQTHVTLEIFNALGQQVAKMVEQEEPAGMHEVTFDGSKLASGVYFYTLRAGKFIETKKLVILK